jgi:sirohydrochlorin ferrochelatase
MTATLLIAAHGTASAAGSATTRALVDAIATRRPGLHVELCFLDVARPTLAEALDALDGEVVVVPLLLSAGYHVTTDIPEIVSGRPGVRVARHLGPDPLIIGAVAERLTEARGTTVTRSTALAAISSSRSSALWEVEAARAALAVTLGRDVTLVPLGPSTHASLDVLPAPVEVAVYLLAEGTFLTELRATATAHAVVAEPLGVHDALIDVTLARYDETAEQPQTVR